LLVNDVVKSPGQPLDHSTRSFMEARLGHDFSNVRVHADDRAAESSRQVNAEAYTVGQHIAFASPSFNPSTDEGRKLLAHELTHVMQQANQGSTSRPISIANPASSSEHEANRVADSFGSGGALPVSQTRQSSSVLQRSPNKKKKRTKVVLVFDDNENTMAEAGARGGTVVRATSVEDAKDKLTALGTPISTLDVISHSSSAGDIEIFDAEGNASWVPISDLSSQLKGAFPEGNQPETVDFSGCKLGEAGAELEAFRDEVGAKEARGNNCWSFTQNATPITIDGNEITEASQVPKNMKAAFDQGILDQIAGMTSSDGQPVGHCIIGLARGEKPSAANLKKLKKLYFANKGRFVATWASPEFNETWQEGSMCAKDLTATTEPCKTVKVKAPKK
jgi:hypothetical protein